MLGWSIRAADDGAGALADRVIDRRDRWGGGRFEETAEVCLCVEELLDALPQRGVLAAHLVQVAGPVLWCLLSSREENGFDAESFAGHGAGSRSGHRSQYLCEKIRRRASCIGGFF
jgi:hypothetical protein